MSQARYDPEQVGVRLREVRARLGLSLAEVEQRSGGRWKATAVGAYERGERALTLPKLYGLADFYAVPPSHLLNDGMDSRTTPAAPQRVVLDLEGLPMLPEPEGDVVLRYITMVQAMRSDWTSKQLPVRQSDLAILAAAQGTSVAELLTMLTDWGLVLPPAGPATIPRGVPPGGRPRENPQAGPAEAPPPVGPARD